jgi:hypothetical protein
MNLNDSLFKEKDDAKVKNYIVELTELLLELSPTASSFTLISI